MLPAIRDVDLAHERSIRHRAEVLASGTCGCFYCGAIFPPSAITDWTDEPDGLPGEPGADVGQTALCPACALDAVIGSASGFPITPEFLARMRARWF